MTQRQAKYCLDQNFIRWSLVEGVVTRKTNQDGPMEGRELPLSQVTRIEKTTLQRTVRSRLAWPVTLAALALLALSVWLAMSWWPLSLPGFAIGLLLLWWGVRRIPPQTETLNAYRLVAPVPDPDDWVLVGSIPEVEGFIAGVHAELDEKEHQAQQPAPP
jgi:hypothetical protein